LDFGSNFVAPKKLNLNLKISIGFISFPIKLFCISLYGNDLLVIILLIMFLNFGCFTITSATVIDFDLDSNNDIVLAAYDSNNQGKFITVPRSGDGTNWGEALSYEAPLVKTLISFDYDQDTFLDMLAVGDELPGDDLNPSNTSTFTVYEEDETNILDTQRDITFTKQGNASLNEYIIITDYDQDGDGGDFLLTFNKFGNNTANFLIGEKQIIDNGDGTNSYVVNTFDDDELGIDNVPYDNAFTIFFDYNIDFDLDAIFIDDDETTNTLNFYIQENDSN